MNPKYARKTYHKNFQLILFMFANQFYEIENR